MTDRKWMMQVTAQISLSKWPRPPCKFEIFYKKRKESSMFNLTQCLWASVKAVMTFSILSNYQNVNAALERCRRKRKVTTCCQVRLFGLLKPRKNKKIVDIGWALNYACLTRTTSPGYQILDTAWREWDIFRSDVSAQQVTSYPLHTPFDKINLAFISAKRGVLLKHLSA